MLQISLPEGDRGLCPDAGCDLFYRHASQAASGFAGNPRCAEEEGGGGPDHPAPRCAPDPEKSPKKGIFSEKRRKSPKMPEKAQKRPKTGVSWTPFFMCFQGVCVLVVKTQGPKNGQNMAKPDENGHFWTKNRVRNFFGASRQNFFPRGAQRW